LLAAPHGFHAGKKIGQPPLRSLAADAYICIMVWIRWIHRLGCNRAGEIRITRFLHNDAVTVHEMVETARARTCAQAAGRHILAIQDTTSVRVTADRTGMSLHPVIAVDACNGALLGLVDARFLNRKGGSQAQATKLRAKGQPALA
jgi:hypothetical protein